MDYIYSESGIWVSGVSYEDGQVLRNAEKKYISVMHWKQSISG